MTTDVVPEAAPPAPEPRPAGAGGALLQLQGLQKHFGAVQALTDVTLDVPAGQVTALVGDNGAGKSVLIKCISGIHQPDGGQILWEGKPVQLKSPRDASALGIETVHQDLALCDNLDIVQNMFLGREKVRHLALAEEDMEKAAAATLSSLAVTTVRSIRQPVASLSGGQRQSVAIAKAVLWNSKLVIMDEPTAALGVAQTRDGARPGPPPGRPGAGGDDRVPQHERRVRGGRPDRGAPPREDGGGAAGGRARPPDRGRPHDQRRVDPDGQRRRRDRGAR